MENLKFLPCLCEIPIRFSEIILDIDNEEILIGSTRGINGIERFKLLSIEAFNNALPEHKPTLSLALLNTCFVFGDRFWPKQYTSWYPYITLFVKDFHRLGELSMDISNKVLFIGSKDITKPYVIQLL